MTLSSLGNFFLGFAITQLVIISIVIYYNWNKKSKNTKSTVNSDTPSPTEKITKLLGFNPYPPEVLLSIIDTSTSSSRRDHLIRKYTKE